MVMRGCAAPHLKCTRQLRTSLILRCFVHGSLGRSRQRQGQRRRAPVPGCRSRRLCRASSPRSSEITSRVRNIMLSALARCGNGEKSKRTFLQSLRIIGTKHLLAYSVACPSPHPSFLVTLTAHRPCSGEPRHLYSLWQCRTGESSLKENGLRCFRSAGGSEDRCALD